MKQRGRAIELKRQTNTKKEQKKQRHRENKSTDETSAKMVKVARKNKAE